MSNDPFPNPHAPYAPPATTPGIPVQQPSEPFASGPAGGQRRKALVIVGLVIILASIGGGATAFLMSGSVADEAVENLARAPVGCTTRLDFDDPGTFTVYVETKGTVTVSSGDCPANGEDYERGSDDLPDVELLLLPEDSDDPEDDEIAFEDDDSKSYDAGGARGQSIGTFEIEEAGLFELTVTSDDDEGDFAIAVGKNPEEAADTLKLISYVVIGPGVILGALLIALGLRRKAPPASGVGAPVNYYSEPPPPAAYVPASPPVAGGFGPPPIAPPAEPPPPTQPMPAPQWPAPPTT